MRNWCRDKTLFLTAVLQKRFEATLQLRNSRQQWQDRGQVPAAMTTGKHLRIQHCLAIRAADGLLPFGGGTAMTIQIGHRESHDIDIFLDDPQLLGFIDP